MKEKEFCKSKIDESKVFTICVKTLLSQYPEIQHGARENDSFRSWDHCRAAFLSVACRQFGPFGNNSRSTIPVPCKECTLTDDQCLRFLALHLSFYLASWGMYRGSSFLCKYDYTVHLDAVKILMQEKYFSLFDPALYATDPGKYIDLVSDIYRKLWGYYQKCAEQLKELRKAKRVVTDTLITKILLGVYGCMPAYDIFFKRGIRAVGGRQMVTCGNISAILKELILVTGMLDAQIKNVLVDAKATWDLQGLYTPMKIVDMIFWKIGELDFAKG